MGATLALLIRTAYRLEPYQNVTGPDSLMRRTYYDVVATMPAGATRSQIPEMLQALMADQLKLEIRREIHDEPVCLLTRGTKALKLKEVPADVTPDLATSHPDGRTPILRTKSSQGYVTYSRLNGTVILDATKITLPELAALLRKEVNMPVFERTGLQGFYEVSLFVPGPSASPTRGRADNSDTFAPAESTQSIIPVASEPEGVNIFRSIQRIGLKLQKSKAPIEHMVVVSAERNPER
jgi:uncharacterized protein (TIGR03435 family)